MLRFAFLALAAFTMLGFTLAEDKKEKTPAELLIGKWKLKKTDSPVPKGFEGEVHFKEKGEMVLIIKMDGKEQKVPGKWELKGEKGKEKQLYTKMTTPNGQEKEATVDIEKLTDKELIIDEKKLKDHFERIKD
ncbi:MAG: hypothetical protein ACRC8S_12500 [Fimbriiglobus sp.]